MEERLAMIVVSLGELENKLKDFVDGQDGIDDLYRGQVKRNKNTYWTSLNADEELEETICKWVRRGKYSKLLNLWVNGLTIDWKMLYRESKPRRVSLPTYPFSRERYWVTPQKVLFKSSNSNMPLKIEDKADNSEEFHSVLLDRVISNEISAEKAKRLRREQSKWQI